MVSNDLSALAALSAKQQGWRELSPETKLGYINGILDAIKSSGPDGFMDMALKDLEMMGMPSTTAEGSAQAAETAFFSCMCIKQTLFGYKQAYEVRADKSKYSGRLKHLLTKKAINGQIVAQIIPGDPASKFNPFGKSNMVGEVWFDAQHVKEQSDVKPFSFDFFDKKKDGVMVVLGAGNWDFLAVCDCLTGLFCFSQVVFLKHHPLRGESLDPLVRKMFASLIEKGYLNTEMDQGLARSSEIVYSDFVTTVQLTGGKPAHDIIMWGSSKEEQDKRKADKDPKLKAEMHAELGAVSPWIVPPVEYSDEELEHLAKSIASGVFNNSSCNCNAPKVLVMSKSWKQAAKLRQMTVDYFSQFETPCCYYPGSKDRWEATKNNAHAADHVEIVNSKKKLSTEERKLKAPRYGNDGPVTLPLLVLDVDVDISTKQGQEEAKSQYAFRHEPFAPTFCFASLVDDGGVNGFLEKAVEFANDYLFGTLSCTMTVPPSLEGTDAVERAIADLQYGDVTLNGWAAISYASGLPWGGYPPKERGVEVETGSAKIFNHYFLPHIEKVVVRTPMVGENHYIKPVEFPDAQDNIEALKFFVSATVDAAKEVALVH